MRILFFAAGTNILPSSRTRVYQYLPYLKERGIGFKTINFTSEGLCRANLMKLKRGLVKKSFDKIYCSFQTIRLLFFSPKYDIVFIQKVLFPPWIFNILKFLNKRIVFDFDDAIFIKDIYKDERFIKRFIHTISFSNLVILENDFTRDFVRKYNKSILLVTGPIDIHRYPLRNNLNLNSNLTIGWIGSPDTARYLAPLFDVFNKLCEEFRHLTIQVVGARKADGFGGRIIFKDWGLDTEVNDLHNFDIGIMPLSNDDWAKGKGGYKLLQYMSCGIPCVATPVGINSKIIREGINGFLADSKEEWKEKLSLLINDEKLRKTMGHNGRKIAVDEYSFEAFREGFILSLEKVALSNRRGLCA